MYTVNLGFLLQEQDGMNQKLCKSNRQTGHGALDSKSYKTSRAGGENNSLYALKKTFDTKIQSSNILNKLDNLKGSFEERMQIKNILEKQIYDNKMKAIKEEEEDRVAGEVVEKLPKAVTDNGENQDSTQKEIGFKDSLILDNKASTNQINLGNNVTTRRLLAKSVCNKRHCKKEPSIQNCFDWKNPSQNDFRKTMTSYDLGGMESAIFSQQHKKLRVSKNLTCRKTGSSTNTLSKPRRTQSIKS